MRIFYYPYQLKTSPEWMIGESDYRTGVLLKVMFEEDLSGYADCHPWTCLGDKPIDQQLHALKNGEMTPLLACTLRFARLDAEARKAQRSLFEDLVIPPTHFLIPNLLSFNLQNREQEFHLYKIKLGKKMDLEFPILHRLLGQLPPSAKLRLDFGGRLSLKQFERFLDHIPIKKIDFFEDPIPFEPNIWEGLQEKYGITLACDQASCQALTYPKSAQVLVIKPAVQSIDPFLQDSRKMVVTSYIDHPLGVMCAAYTASKAFKEYPEKLLTCGLLTHEVYLPDAFTSEIKRSGNHLRPPKGYGFGFDELLSQLPWQTLHLADKSCSWQGG